MINPFKYIFWQGLYERYRLGAGAWIGKGQEWFPWIHIKDIVGVYLHALEHESLQGALNAAAPELIRQKPFFKTLGLVMQRPVLISIPVPILRVLYGQVADIFKDSLKVTSQKLLHSGYAFAYPRIVSALESASDFSRFLNN